MLSPKRNRLYKKGAAFKSPGEKSCEIKGGGHEMAAMMLMVIHFNNAFFTQDFEGYTLLYSLAVFAWISLLFVFYISKISHKMALRLVFYTHHCSSYLQIQ